MAHKRIKLLPWHILNDQDNPDSCILFLPGRDHSGSHMGNAYKKLGLSKPLLVSITPRTREWYPMPNGVEDQDDAVEGQERACHTINEVVDKIETKYNISRERMILCGYSAGGVMAIQVASHSHYCFAGVVSHAGAILDPDSLPTCRCDTPFLLTHNRDDLIFEWYERYIPMVETLKEKGYTVFTIENGNGGHMVHDSDMIRAKHFMDACLKRIGAK